MHILAQRIRHTPTPTPIHHVTAAGAHRCIARHDAGTIRTRRCMRARLWMHTHLHTHTRAVLYYDAGLRAHTCTAHTCTAHTRASNHHSHAHALRDDSARIRARHIHPRPRPCTAWRLRARIAQSRAPYAHACARRVLACAVDYRAHAQYDSALRTHTCPALTSTPTLTMHCVAPTGVHRSITRYDADTIRTHLCARAGLCVVRFIIAITFLQAHMMLWL